MLRSMTGFGVGKAGAATDEVTVEIRSVNHKFCEVKARLPRELASLEGAVVKQVKERLARGAIEVTVKRSAVSSAATVPTVDVELARQYRRAFAELSAATGLPDDVRVQHLAALPGVVRMEEPRVDVESAQKSLAAGLDAALSALIRMREVEGLAMAQDLSVRLSLVETWSTEAAALSPRSVEEYRQRLADRISELAKGLSVEPQRLAQEVAFFAERTDVAEEATRLASHLAQFRTLMTAPEPTGRKMDFLVQEMHREVNTTGSKSQHPELSLRVVAMKAEIERIREQVQNVE